MSGYSGFEHRCVYLRIRRRENAKTRTTKSPCAVYWDNDLATATVTAAADLTGRRDIKQEVVWILGRRLNYRPAVSLHYSQSYREFNISPGNCDFRNTTNYRTHFNQKEKTSFEWDLFKPYVLIQKSHQLIFTDIVYFLRS